MEQTNTTQSGRAVVQIIALALMGLGLLVIGVVAWTALPGLLGASSGQADDLATARPVAVDFPAPALELTDLHGNPVSLQNLRGGYTLVNLWATWCPPCKAEMPTLLKYYEDKRHLGFTIVAIDAGEPVETVARYARQNQLTFPVWPDPDQIGMDAFDESYLPSSYLIDPAGQVVLYWGGAISRAMLDTYVPPLLEGKDGSQD